MCPSTPGSGLRRCGHFEIGKWRASVHCKYMAKSGEPDKVAGDVAEEVLRTIYGDDFRGCKVQPDRIAAVITEGLKSERVRTRELIELYEKVVEAIDLLSTPPDGKEMKDPNELRTLLGERLDCIHAVTTRTIKTTAAARGEGRGS